MINSPFKTGYFSAGSTNGILQNNYLNKLLQNISKEQKSIFLLEDFNVDLLNYNEHN